MWDRSWRELQKENVLKKNVVDLITQFVSPWIMFMFKFNKQIAYVVCECNYIVWLSGLWCKNYYLFLLSFAHFSHAPYFVQVKLLQPLVSPHFYFLNKFFKWIIIITIIVIDIFIIFIFIIILPPFMWTNEWLRASQVVARKRTSERSFCQIYFFVIM